MPCRGHRWRWGKGSFRVIRFLEPILLLLLHQGAAHGYILLERLRSLGMDGVDPGVVYRALRDMEKRGWLSSTLDREQTQGPPRRVYSLTSLGDEALRLWVQELEETSQMVNKFLQGYYQHMEGHPQRNEEGAHDDKTRERR